MIQNQQDFENFLHENGWIIFGKYIDYYSPVIILCATCNTSKNLKRARYFNCYTKCNKCDNRKMMSEDEFEKILLSNNLKLISEYDKLHGAKVSIQCLKCDDIRVFNHASSILKHPTCKKCGYRGRKRSFNDYIKLLNDVNLELISNNKFLNIESEVTVKCLICKKENTLKQLKNAIKAGCANCNKKYKYSIETVKNECKKHGLEFLDEKYVSIRWYHNFRCKNNHYTIKPWGECLRSFKKNSNGCKECASDSFRLDLDFIKGESIKNGFEFLDEFYKNKKTKHTFKCLKCDFKWQTQPACILNMGSGCPKCNLRLNEKLTGEYLSNLLPNITIYNPKRINCDNTCDVRNKIFVDFYFEIVNIQIIIEYNGLQHYKNVKFGGQSDSESKILFEEQKTRDRWLRKYCKNNNIILIEIDGRKHTKDSIKSFLIEKFDEFKLPYQL